MSVGGVMNNESAPLVRLRRDAMRQHDWRCSGRCQGSHLAILFYTTVLKFSCRDFPHAPTFYPSNAGRIGFPAGRPKLGRQKDY